ncbi:hypothetical protein [Streptomyces sp. NPDC047525]|uniref:hypothetical protein n=1 Tax=Streptomyces sp. NPDC047525 TaxID=3155264 RepID=UPI0033E48D91
MPRSPSSPRSVAAVEGAHVLDGAVLGYRIVSRLELDGAAEHPAPTASRTAAWWGTVE